MCFLNSLLKGFNEQEQQEQLQQERRQQHRETTPDKMSELERARVAWRSYHDWVLPRRAVQVILATALLFLFLGLLLLAIGGAVGIGGLVAAGAVLAGIGGCGLMVCLLLCLHAYFIFNVRDEAVQTTDNPWSDEVLPHEIAGYASINKPSALKSADSTLRRNGGAGKKVTMAPDVALDADVRAPALRSMGASGDAASPNLYLASPASPGYRTLGSYAIVDTAGPGGGGRGAGMGGGGGGGVRTSGGDSAMESFDQRSFAQQHQFQTAAQLQMALQQQQEALQRQQEDLDIQQQRQKLEFHRQQLLQQQQQQQHQHQHHHQQQQHHFRVQQTPQPQSVTYAQVQRFPAQGAVVVQHSPSPSLSSQQSSVFTTGSVSGVDRTPAAVGGGAMLAGGGHSNNFISGGGGGGGGAYRIQTAGLQYQSGRPYAEDDDYDNPAERTPMLPPAAAASSSSSSVVDHRRHQQQPSPSSFSYSAGGGESLRAGGSVSGSQYSIHRQQGSTASSSGGGGGGVVVGGGGGATPIPIQHHHAGSGALSSSSLMVAGQAAPSGNQRVVTATASSSASPFPLDQHQLQQLHDGRVGGQRYTSSFSTRVEPSFSSASAFPPSSASSSSSSAFITQQPHEQGPPFFLAGGRSSSASASTHHHHQQQQQQQQQHYQQSSSRSSSFASSVGGGGVGGGGGAGKGVTFSSGVKGGGVGEEEEAELPEPTPLQHPSERRPMTFEQQSSSKMSIYDNVLFPYAEADGE